jgi:excisionase family DNA binding protein
MSDLKNKEVFTISDAAEFLSVNKNTIYNWMNLGIIKGTRISPRKVLIYKKDILRIFEDSKGYEPPKRK